MRLVDDQVVDPGLLEGEAEVARSVQALAQAFFDAQDEFLKPFHGQAVLAAGSFEHRAELRELLLAVAKLGVPGDG